METKDRQTQKKGWIDRTMTRIEKAGTALPDPVTMFFLISVAILIIS